MIPTRMEGRPRCPEREGIRALAASGNHGDFPERGTDSKLCEQLIPAYGENTPGSGGIQGHPWQDEKIVRATLGTLAAFEVEAAGIIKTALILVGGFFWAAIMSCRSCMTRRLPTDTGRAFPEK